MMHRCPISQEPDIGGVCGLLGAEEITGTAAKGIILALREIVEHFHIRWEMRPHRETESEDKVETGFVLELTGTHELVGHHTGRTCSHCANLILGLRIIGDWIFPPDGKCFFCQVQPHSNFVRGDQHGQQKASSTRTVRLASQVGSRCQLEACHSWCMTKIKERLGKIGARKQEKKQLSVERAQS